MLRLGLVVAVCAALGAGCTVTTSGGIEAKSDDPRVVYDASYRHLLYDTYQVLTKQLGLTDVEQLPAPELGWQFPYRGITGRVLLRPVVGRNDTGRIVNAVAVEYSLGGRVLGRNVERRARDSIAGFSEVIERVGEAVEGSRIRMWGMSYATPNNTLQRRGAR